jgi:hypothetical protein
MASNATPDLEGDLEALREAVGECQHVLDHVCRYHEDWFDAELREVVQRARDEVEHHWDPVLEAINPNNESRLAEAGLLGAQREAKSRGLRKRAREFFRSPSKRAFKKVAQWINILLGSLASIVPGGEALKEFKEVVEAAMSDDPST